jgi:hypothetical protein
VTPSPQLTLYIPGAQAIEVPGSLAGEFQGTGRHDRRGHQLLLRSAVPVDASWDGELRAETDEALALTGKDVGTPIIHFGPPRGTAFFGPVISRLPSGQEALRLWDHVVGLASFPGFAELKRSLRERPQLRSFGVNPGQTGIQEDWHGGSRRLTK